LKLLQVKEIGLLEYGGRNVCVLCFEKVS